MIPCVNELLERLVDHPQKDKMQAPDLPIEVGIEPAAALKVVKDLLVFTYGPITNIAPQAFNSLVVKRYSLNEGACTSTSGQRS